MIHIERKAELVDKAALSQKFYKNVKKCCKYFKYSIGEVEKAAGINRGELSRWRGNGIKLAEAVDISNILEVDLNFLLSEEIDMEVYKDRKAEEY